MTEPFRFHFTGEKELDAKLTDLAIRAGLRIAVAGTKVMARRIYAAQIRATPRDRRRIDDRSIGMRLKSKGNKVEAISGFGVGQASERDEQWYDFLLIVGTDDRYTGQRVRKSRKGERRVYENGNPKRYRGRITPSEHLKQAAAAAAPSALNAGLNAMSAELEREGAM